MSRLCLREKRDGRGGTGTEVSVKITSDEKENAGFEKAPLVHVALPSG